MGKNKRGAPAKSKGKGKGKGKSKARQSITSNASDDGDALLDEEITALSAIFQNDFSVVADHLIKELTINLRPHSENENDFSAHLFVRCFPGYPWKPPKLQIAASDKSLETECHILHGMLVEQAALCAREGRVMIFNLVEAAQEYFSECLANLAQEQKKELDESIAQMSEPPIVKESEPVNSDFVYCDLWENSGTWEGPDSLPTGQTPLEKEIPSSSIPSRPGFRRPPALVLPELKPRDSKQHIKGLDADNEPREASAEDEQLSKDAAVSEFLLKAFSGYKQPAMTSEALGTGGDDDAIFAIQKDLILVYLLRLACGKKGPLPNSLSELTSQLSQLGIMPSWAEDLVSRQPQMFQATFKRIFKQTVDKDNVSEFKRNLERFWNASPDLLGENDGNLAAMNSRYLSDFEELCLLGKGGFGHVVLCKNKLDGRRYAMKKVKLKDENPSDKILREVATLSRLQHQHVVRYYQAWFETAAGGSSGTPYGEESEISSSWVDTPGSSSNDVNTVSTFLYIQMEYCPRTLREVFDTRSVLDKELTWGIFRQIVEGLSHIHGQGIIHRDLTPSNIFFDTRNDVKIGDFGLAKFADLQNPDQDHRVPVKFEANVKSLEGTGQVGTYFYRAPEIEQAWPHIDEKVDMYSLGVILFELWHPFSTGMERYVTLNELKQQNILPSNWAAKFPHQAALVHLLVSPHPQDRPSAREVLQSELLPPRMEDEALKDILRTIHSTDNTFVFDQVIAALFDEEKLASKTDNEANLSIGDLDHLTPKWLTAQELVIGLTKDVLTRHGARKFRSPSMTVASDVKTSNRSAVKVINSSGTMFELRYDTRLLFARWVVLNQSTSWKRYEISHTYRKGVGYRAPKEYLQGDFDIIGGYRALAEAEVIKAAADIISRVSSTETCELRLNHLEILDTIWSWSGVTRQQRKNVAQILGTMTFLRPQSADRKARWVFVRRQLIQGLHLSEAVVDRLQTAERRFTGNADEVLARLRGALSNSPSSIEAIEELSRLLSYLRNWRVEMLLTVDVFIVPSDYYFNAAYFQIYFPRTSYPGAQGMLLAVGGRYDVLLEHLAKDYGVHTPPGAVGLTIALQKLIHIAMKDSKNETEPAEVLVCCRGGGGLLKERMELADELWSANVKADFVCAIAPSLTEQYEYAHDNGIKVLVIITESGLSQGVVKVRHLDFKFEVDVRRDDLAKSLADLISGPLAVKMLRQSLI
ncbi:eIF-2-alpha kinase GCN2 isoform X2 [Selaginella moellendorffii]|uniref:eIF-2-alpha kinase GCN2 isoform X2 n=1 Tax=Selaginella moellendorffii TaxID=88036 RepID=UPI000D1CDF81|nr:eIF-2-alpha kinase GCN2 isoform X2 [Selaginella moellendorffii]|eukprot:XP_024542885.1 eIF-2-alpha kinase GCN2 isoform X2 [Selaginella moellendorffii]